MKKELLLSFALINMSLMTSCNNFNNITDNTKIVYLNKNNEIDSNNKESHIFKISEKKGSSLTFTINKPNLGFNTKATTNGVAAKIASDVLSYQVYLIKSSSGTSYPLNGDPLGVDKVAGPYVFNTNNASSNTVTFTNVSPSSTNYYYIAVRAYSGINATGVELIKSNNGSSTAWTGTTSLTNQVAVSSGVGVNVGIGDIVNPLTPLTVTSNLIDAISSTIDAKIVTNLGDPTTINSYALNLCTEPTKPLTTKVLSTPIIVNRNSSQLINNSHSVTFKNISSGSYYVTVEAFSSSNGGGTSLITANNGATPYSSPDNDSKVAVSSNVVNITSSQEVIFSPSNTNNGLVQINFFTPILEFKVNTYITEDQKASSIASDNNGNFIITWHSRYQDGSGYGIYAQRYNSLGIPQGSEFRVNTYTTNWQRNPSIAMDYTGNFVITWDSNGQISSSNSDDIYAQRYNSLGIPQGSEFRVNTYTTNWQRNPSIAMDYTGNFVITWDSNGQDGSGYGIYAQRYNSLGIPQGSEFRVNTYTTLTQKTPSITSNNNGNFIITWFGYGVDGIDNGYGIYAQIYNSLGIPQGSEFRVNTYTTREQVIPVIASDSNGNFIITWTSYEQDGSKNGIYAQRYNNLGIPQGSEFKVNTYTTNNQSLSSIASDSNGNFIITWTSYEQDGSKNGIYAQRYNNLGIPQGSEFKVNTYTTREQVIPAIASDSNGNFIITWQSYEQDGSKNGIYAKRYTNQGIEK
jgi:hypothetical protein